MLIYLIYNKINGKKYVGQTTRALIERWNEHCIPSRIEFPIDRAIKKHGKENFEISILAEVDSITELNALETFYIEQQHSLSPDGYNLHTGGLNHQVSNETRMRMSQSHRGKPLSEEHKARIFAATNGNRTWLCKQQSDETKKKRSEKMKEIRRVRFWSTCKAS